MVQRRQFGGCQVLQRWHVDQGRQQQRLRQTVVGEEGVGRLQGIDIALLQAMAGQQHRTHPLGVEATGVVELHPHTLGQWLQPTHDNGIEQRRDGDDLRDPRRCAALTQKQRHHLERGPLSLQQTGQKDQGVHQGGRERIHLGERNLVGLRLVTHQRIPGHAVGLQRRECLCDRLGRALIDRRQQPPLRDVRQVGGLEDDRVEAVLPVPEGVPDRTGLRPFGPCGFGVEVLQLPLPRNERDDWDVTLPDARLHQFGDLRALLGDELLVVEARRQPQDEFVEEEDKTVVPEALGMSGHHTESVADVEPLAGGRVAGEHRGH